MSFYQGFPTEGLGGGAPAEPAPLIQGEVIFERTTATQCRLRQFGLGRFVLGEAQATLDGEITIDNSGLLAATLYYAYVYDNAGTLTLEFSTTVYTQHTDGTKIKTGDPTRALVGMIRTNGAAQFADTPTQRFVRSWFNAGVSQAETLDLTIRNVSGGAWLALSTVVAEFIKWANDAVEGSVSAEISNSGTSFPVTRLRAKMETSDEVGPEAATRPSSASNNQLTTAISRSAFTLAEGYHYLVGEGQVTSSTGSYQQIENLVIIHGGGE